MNLSKESMRGQASSVRRAQPDRISMGRFFSGSAISLFFSRTRNGDLPNVAQMGKLLARTSQSRFLVALFSLLFLASCSPRDFLTRRLATDLIAGSEAFSAPQLFVLRTGVVSSKDYAAPEYLVLQRHGWLAATAIACSPGVAPPPCWDVLLTPSGVDTVRNLVSAEDASKASIAIPAARREIIAITGISKQGNTADIEFTWKWAPGQRNRRRAILRRTPLQIERGIS